MGSNCCSARHTCPPCIFYVHHRNRASVDLTYPSDNRRHGCFQVPPLPADIHLHPSDDIHPEGLPYLTAAIKEGLRLSYGVSTRLQRIDPDNSIVYTDKKTGKEWVIPPKTPVGQTAIHIHHGEDISPDSNKFIAERWLNGNGRELEKYLFSFCQGSRKCLGVNLAYGELYLVLGAIFRLRGRGGEHGFRGTDDIGVLSLYKTGLKDVVMDSDRFIPAPQKGSKGVRVKAFS